MLSAQQAMQQAIERAQMGEWEGARVFLDIARELRQGASPAPLTDGPEEDTKPCYAADRILDYRRGQIDLPDESTVRYAARRRAAIHAGVRPDSVTETSLLDEILTRNAQASGEAVDATETMVRLGADGYPTLTYGAPVTLQRQPDPPIYASAGETLGDTRSVPQRIAHPQEDSQGPESTCLNPDCKLKVIWIKGRGWVHDTPSHTASCDKAAQEVPGGGE